MVGFFFLLLVVSSVHCSHFRASEVDSLIELELEFLGKFKNYAKELREKLRLVEGAISEYTDLIFNAIDNPDLYLSNPAYAFKLIRHLRQDWVAWKNVMEQNLGADQIMQLKLLLKRLPSESLLQKSVENLRFVVNFYGVTPEIVHMGTLPGLKLSPFEIYHLAVKLQFQGKLHEAADWLAIAVDNYTTSPHNDVIGIPHWRVYELQAKVFIGLNMHDEALAALGSAIQLQPYNLELREQRQELKFPTRHMPNNPIEAAPADIDDLQLVCRRAKVQADMYCEYNTIVSEFLQLAPLRADIIQEQPFVVLYHNAINDREIHYIKNALHRCPPSLRFEDEKGIWGCQLPDNYSPKTLQINARIQDMSSVSKLSEGFTVIEYATTEPFDLLELPHFQNVDLDEIEASVIIFLNNVSMGGAVTMPYYDVTVLPQRGDALVSFHEANEELQICPNAVGTSLAIVKLLFSDD